MTTDTNPQYIKKVISLGLKSSPKARGERLKKLRNMANLSRRQICIDCNLNLSTYKGWEIARHGGLPLDGAKKIITKIAKIGITCSIDWLLHGKGDEPFVLPKIAKCKDNIAKEISLFKLIVEDAVSAEIIDDGLYPTFQPGDFVAGIKHNAADLSKVLGHYCIVQLSNNEIVVRKIEAGAEQDRFTLICTNQDTKLDKPLLPDQKLAFAAPIIRHYKRSTNLT